MIASECAAGYAEHAHGEDFCAAVGTAAAFQTAGGISGDRMESLKTEGKTCRVALLFDGWKRLITAAWTEGILRECEKIQKETGTAIDLVQYQCWGNATPNLSFNEGEYAVFQLPDLSRYDGIICDLTNIVDGSVRQAVIQKVRDANVPAVSLCIEVPGLLYAGADGRSAEKKIIEHLFQVHHCRSFFFAGGPEDNYENRERLRAFEECMEAHHVPEDQRGFCFGTYETQSGTAAMRGILESGRPLPDAIVSANDNIAVGVILEAEKHGIHVPEDVRVTGFDCLDKAMYFDPQITSAEIFREGIGALAMRVLFRKMSGQTVTKHSYAASPCHFTESCGCPNTGEVSYRSYVRGQIVYGIESQKADDRQAHFESQLMECQTFAQFRDCILQKCRQLDDDGAFIVLDERLTDPENGGALPAVCDRKHLKVLGGFEKDGSSGDTMLFAGAPEQTLQEHLLVRKPGQMLFVTPLHLKERAAGYIVIENPRFLSDYENIYRMHKGVLNTLQEIWNHQRIEESMRQLKALYERDRLTGVYQRAALKDRIEPAFREMLSSGSKVGVCFADADRFKRINDRRGHEFGDRVLQKIAKALQENLPGTGYVCRYGEDEFLAILEVTDEEGLEAYWECVRTDLLRKPDQACDLPPVQISMGMVLAPDASLGSCLDDYINAADRKMYTVKGNHHGRE